MKTLLLAGLFLVAACGKTENAFNKLSPEEKNWLIEQGRVQCLSDVAKDFKTFKAKSAEQFFELTRGDTFTHQVKVKSVDTELRSTRIQVWKVRPTAIYLLLTHTSAEDSTPDYQFVKVTPQTNNEMIDSLMQKRCSKVEGTTATQTNSNMTYNVVSSTNVAGDRKTVSTKVNTSTFDHLALFGNFHYTLKVETFTRDGKAVPEVPTKITDGTIKPVDDIAFDYATYSGYADAKADLCVIDFTPGSPNTYAYPFILDCAPTSGEFDPSELAI